ncbi:DUF6151 family protein [Roseovarius aestuarii]|nr:DUF6151 family protein [Roseovarius aestuarii]
MSAAAGQFTHACRCGAVRLTIAVPWSGAGGHVMCYCSDCQLAARLHENGADVLTPAGGTNIWHTVPNHIGDIAGAGHLSILRLSPRGMFRWHAGCCGTPLINTFPNLALPFAGVVLRQSELDSVAPVTGPVTCHYSTVGALRGAGAPAQDSGVPRAIIGIGSRMLRALVSAKSRRNPLRSDDGSPIAPKRVVTLEERQAARV